MTFGERISDLRKAAGLSQGQLASLLQVSRQAVCKWENDQSSPDTLKLIKLADVLNTEVEYIVTGNKPVYEHPVVVNLIRKETEVQEKIVEKIVEKPVIRKVTRTRNVRNPIEFLICGLLCFLAGLLIGILI